MQIDELVGVLSATIDDVQLVHSISNGILTAVSAQRTLSMQKGMVLVGTNGCGKSSVLNLIAASLSSATCFLYNSSSLSLFNPMLDSHSVILVDDVDSIEDWSLLVNAIDADNQNRYFLCTCTSPEKVDRRLTQGYRLGRPQPIPPLSQEKRMLMFAKFLSYIGDSTPNSAVRLAISTRNSCQSDMMKFARELYYSKSYSTADINAIPINYDGSTLITSIDAIPDLVNMEKAQFHLLHSIYSHFLSGSRARSGSAYNQRTSSGFVIHGDSGTGKSALVHWLAGITMRHFKLVSVSCSDLVHKVVGETEKYISKVFEFARRVGPTLLWLDNLDSILPSRSPDGDDSEIGNQRRGQRTAHKTMDRLLSTLLVEIDGLGNYHQSGNKPSIFESNSVVVIVTVNQLDSLDRSLLRPGRLEEHIMLSLPDLKQRRKYLCRLFGDTVKRELLDLLAASCSNRSYAELKELHQSAEFSFLKNTWTKDEGVRHIKTEYINNWIEQKITPAAS